MRITHLEAEEVRHAGWIEYLSFTCRPRFINAESANIISIAPACRTSYALRVIKRDWAGFGQLKM